MAWHRQKNAGYVWKPTVNATAGASAQFKRVKTDDGTFQACRWGVGAACNGVKGIIYLRAVWMVMAATTCTIFVAMQWGFASNLMPQFLERNYGEGQPYSWIHSINLWGCVIGPPIVASLTGHLEATSVLMPGKPHDDHWHLSCILPTSQQDSQQCRCGQGCG